MVCHSIRRQSCTYTIMHIYAHLPLSVTDKQGKCISLHHWEVIKHVFKLHIRCFLLIKDILHNGFVMRWRKHRFMCLIMYFMHFRGLGDIHTYIIYLESCIRPIIRTLINVSQQILREDEINSEPCQGCFDSILCFNIHFKWHTKLN